MDPEIIARLPKAGRLGLRWSWRHWYFARFRLANARQWQVGWLTIIARAPWLEQSARASHLHLFKEHEQKDVRP